MAENTKLDTMRKRKRKQRKLGTDDAVDEERAEGPRARRQYKGFAAVEAPEVTPAVPEQAAAIVHEVRDFSNKDKQANLVEFVQAIQAREQSQRKKTKFFIYVKKREAGRALAAALSTKSKKKMKKKIDEGSQLQRSMLKTTFESKGALFIQEKTYTEQIDYAVHCFRSGKLPVLIVTEDVAHAVHDQKKSIGCIINFDLPSTIEAYQKRVGYCGKVPGGTVLSYYSGTDGCKQLVPELRTFLKSIGQGTESTNGWLEKTSLEANKSHATPEHLSYEKAEHNVSIKAKASDHGRRHINNKKSIAIRIMVKSKRNMIKSNKKGHFVNTCKR
jgi:superfamily II DNA/RNA helicase